MRKNEAKRNLLVDLRGHSQIPCSSRGAYLNDYFGNERFHFLHGDKNRPLVDPGGQCVGDHIIIRYGAGAGEYFAGGIQNLIQRALVTTDNFVSNAGDSSRSSTMDGAAAMVVMRSSST